MRVGDVLEWLAAAAFAGVAYGYGGYRPALAVTGVALLYFAQCFARHEFPRPKLRGRLVLRARAARLLARLTRRHRAAEASE